MEKPSHVQEKPKRLAYARRIIPHALKLSVSAVLLYASVEFGLRAVNAGWNGELIGNIEGLAGSGVSTSVLLYKERGLVLRRKSATTGISEHGQEEGQQTKPQA